MIALRAPAACAPCRGPISRRGAVRCTASAAPPPKYYILKYDYVPDILEKRGPYRAEHIGGAQKAADEGKLLMGGAFGDPPEGGLLLFKPDVAVAEIEAFVAADPYVKNGLVTAWSIKPYAVVVGP